MIHNLLERLKPPPKSGLYEVVWSITSQCDLECQYCYSGSSRHGLASVSAEGSKYFIDMFTKLETKIIAFTGGEPLLNKQFFKIAHLCRDKFRIIFLSTNGSHIDKQTALKIKDCGIDSVQVSIDGPEDVHDHLRGVKGSFKKAIRALVFLKDVGVDVAIAPTLTSYNVNYLEYLINLAFTFNCDVSIKRVILTGHGKGKKSLSLDRYEYKRAYEYANKINGLGKIHVFMHCDPLRFLLFDENKRKDFEKLSLISGGCMAGVGLLYINPNGNVYPCSKLPVLCGNIHKTSLSEIWRNANVLNILRQRNLFHGRCGKCIYLNVCGGCRASAYEQHHDVLAEDYLCWFTLSNHKNNSGKEVKKWVG